MMKKTMVLAGLLTLFCIGAAAQKVILFLGTSTVGGAAASAGNLTMAGRTQALFRQNTSAGDPDTIVYTMQRFGGITWNAIPYSYVPTNNRGGIDPNSNIDLGISTYHPDIVILNFPSNDVSGFGDPATCGCSPVYTIQETLDNLQAMYNAAVASGAKCFVTTPQPRNDMGAAQKQMQVDIRNYVMAHYGNFALNFWDVLVTNDGTNSLRDDVRHLGYPDEAYHLNDYGHQLIYEVIRDRNIFNVTSPTLPLSLKDFTASLLGNAVSVRWHTESEETNSFFEVQRGYNGTAFTTLARIDARANGQPAAYEWTDPQPAEGKNFYRLRINENGRLRYSPIVMVSNGLKSFSIGRLIISHELLTADIATDRNGSGEVAVVNLAGAVLKKRTVNFSRPLSHISVPLAGLPSGEYLLMVRSADGSTDTRRFSRIK